MMQCKAKFMELSHFAPHIVADDAMKAHKFQFGLKPIICSHMFVLRLKTFMDVVETSHIVERESDEL